MIIGSIALVLAAFLVSAMVVFTPRVSIEQKQLSPTEFFENGTGIVYFANGTVLHFNHTLTPQNGYRYENGTIHYASNGTQVDLTKVDRNSLIITEIIQPQQQQQQPPLTAGTSADPELQRFDQIANGCKATILRLYPGAETTNDVFLVPPQGATSADFSQMTQCNQLLRQGIAQYCNTLQTYDAAKCAYVNTPQILNLIDMTAIIAKQEFLYGSGGLG
jgi:hypothetical protein